MFQKLTTNATLIVKPQIKEGFAAIDNNIVYHADLSPIATKILVWLRTLPSDWEVNTKHACKHLRLCKNTYYKYTQELRDKSLLDIVEIRDEKGRFTGKTQFVLKDPDLDKLEAIQSPTKKICTIAHSPRNDTTDKSPKNGVIKPKNPHKYGVTSIAHEMNPNKYIYKRTKKHVLFTTRAISP
ncbi:hypothetical protein [Helicobacter suis]|uniref:Helix-turn-helix domain-containing protein n=1 Tax=Helicobacter suis TaxID=104628 RepID=A0A6J4CYK6_9HELI|nr:hypothetical protein [Helicobacter suis]BCD69782.1 hypothetical protein SNTW_04270 [Helicobacter suis]